MSGTANKVVKCKNSQCRLYFTLTEKDTKCPFCKTDYAEVTENPASPAEASAAKKEKKVTAKTQKESFKMEW